MVLVGLGLLGGVLLFEGYLRLTDQGGEGFLQPDPYLGTFHIPKKRFVWQKACFRTDVKFNSRGLRDVEHTLEKPAGVYRIVVLGDSYAEALQVKLEESFPKVLERLLNEANLGKRFEVINMASSGFGTDQEYLSLKHYGVQYRPDLVILAFLTGNDVRNNYYVLERQENHWPKPFFVFDENGNLVQLPFRSSNVGQLRGILAHFRIYGWLRNRVYETPVLHRWLWKLGLVGANPPGATRPDGRQDGEPNIPLDFQVYLEDYPHDWEEAWRITRALILKTKEEAGRHGARFILVSLTDGTQLADSDRVEGEYPAMAERQYNVDKPVEILTAFSKEASIDYLPLVPIFRAYLRKHQESIEHFHYSCDGHWTPLGHRLAAEAIFTKIVSDRLYQPGS